MNFSKKLNYGGAKLTSINRHNDSYEVYMCGKETEEYTKSGSF